MLIDKQSPIPAYYQLKLYIKEQIDKNKWKEGSSIPSERELSQKCSISRMTVRQAINELVNEGILYKVKGKGTFIKRSIIEQINIDSFSTIVESKGMKPNSIILAFHKNFISADVSNSLLLPAKTPLFFLKRLRKADSIPVGIEEVFIPEEFCPSLESYDLTKSLYSILYEHYSYKIERLDIKIEAVLPNNQEKELLDINGFLPLLKVSGNSVSNTGLNLIYENSCYRSDQLSYRLSIMNRTGY